MEVIGRLWGRLWDRLGLLWLAFANTIYGFIEEVDFRVALALRILTGKVPIRSEKRPWIRSVECPILVDVYSWVDERLLFSILVWPSLESDLADAYVDQHDRLEEILGAFAAGAAEKRWSTYWEVEHLEWDGYRECWADADGIAYDARRLFAYSRGVGGVGEYPGRGEKGEG
jgi:hypothetical protein